MPPAITLPARVASLLEPPAPEVRALVVGAVLFIATPAYGQTPHPLTAPGDEHRHLDVLAGSWDVTVRFPVGPGREAEGRATCEANWVLDGRFLRQEYSSVLAGRPHTVVRYLGFDRHRDRFVSVHFESSHTDVMTCEGTMSPDGKTFTCSGRHIDARTGRDIEVETVLTVKSSEAFELVMRYLYGDTARVVTLEHLRRR